MSEKIHAGQLFYYNLTKRKFGIQTCEQPMLARLRERNCQTSGKNALIWEEREGEERTAQEIESGTICQ